MAQDPYYGDDQPVEATNIPPWPGYDDPWAQQFQDFIGGLDIQGISEGIRNQAPGGFLEMLTQFIPPGQIAQFAMNQFSGKGIAPKVERYKELGLGQVNRAFTGVYDTERQKMAATGGRGSSFQAALEAKGRGALGTARAGVETGALGYEEELRTAGWEKGMGVVGAVQKALRGDVEASNQYVSMILENILGVRGQDLDAMMAAGDMNFEQFMAMMEHEQWMQEISRGGRDVPPPINISPTFT